VEFVPPVSRAEIGAEMQRASILCVPSRWQEAYNLVVTEGLACGLPVIAARRGGIPEALGDVGLYFDPPDVETLAAHLERLLRDPAERIRLGKLGRQRAEEATWEKRYPLLLEAIK
jgi:glycosyltransferase involved in cell wall biosynthesis